MPVMLLVKPNYPDETNVRKDVLFGDHNEKTGTLDLGEPQGFVVSSTELNNYNVQEILTFENYVEPIIQPQELESANNG